MEGRDPRDGVRKNSVPKYLLKEDEENNATRIRTRRARQGWNQPPSQEGHTYEVQSRLALIRLQQLCAATASLLLEYIGQWSGREIDASQAGRLGRSCLSIACSALSLARSAQAERDNESSFFPCGGGHRTRAPPHRISVSPPSLPSIMFMAIDCVSRSTIHITGDTPRRLAELCQITHFAAVTGNATSPRVEFDGRHVSLTNGSSHESGYRIDVAPVGPCSVRCSKTTRSKVTRNLEGSLFSCETI
ncbi:hypothetical protein EVAR_95200_1 [Eumeta japonica]|uniref:Uncharacterized protein n=1 Tax=Eumeta variegata TaxID=151549 RepID=A0A4C1VHE0_EUMVA|nr:hypothetical protein EVAR_95200_1 [Eumeta japonica]